MGNEARMKVAIIIYSMHAGGAERVTAHLANAWAECGWEVTLVTMASRKQDFYRLHLEVKRQGLDLSGDSTDLSQALVMNVRRVRALRRVLRELNPDVVLGMMTTAAVLAIIAARGLGCRVIVCERTYPPMLPIGRQWNALRRITYPRAFRVVMLTMEGVRWLESNIPKAKGVVIPNPVPYSLPVGEPLLPVERFTTPERKVLLAVGRLDEGKQFDRLIESFAALAPQHPSWDLLIAGEGPERPRLEQQIAALSLQRRISLLGLVGNLGDWYRRADLYVMSSRFEGFPNTLTEAMAHGCAAVSYDCDTGPRDIIRHEQDGLLVRPVGDVPALTRALERLMGDEALRGRLAAQAVEVRQRYSMAKILEMWDKLFDAVPASGKHR